MQKKIITLSANTSWYLFNFRRSTIEELIKMNYQVICISPKDNFSEKLEDLGCKILSIKMDSKGTNPFKDIFIFLKHFFIYKKLRPILAFHFTVKNNIYGTWAANLLKIPSINNITGLGTAFLKNNLTSLVVRGLYKLSQPYAFKVFCQNKEDYSFLINQNLIKENKLFLLPGSGVNLKKFHPNLKKNLQKRNKNFILLFSGRMIADKGLFELIDALKIINRNEIKCQLWLQGFVNNQNHSSLSASQISSWGKLKWIEWRGATDKIEEVMSQVDGVVLPSYREGMPRTLLEACAMELPVVTTNVPGCNEIIQDGINGFLCEPRDHISLMHSIKKLIETPPEKRLKMGKRGREKVKNEFDEKYVIDAAISSVLEVSNS